MTWYPRIMRSRPPSFLCLAATRSLRSGALRALHVAVTSPRAPLRRLRVAAKHRSPLLHVREAKPVAADDLSNAHRYRLGEHRPRETERVKLPSLAARIDSRGQLGEQGLVEQPPCEF